MKFKYIFIILVTLLVLVLSSSLYILNYKYNKLENQYSESIINQKAFINENTILKNTNQQFKFTVEQLEYYNDSLLIEMNNIRKELGIKNEDIKNLQYLLSTAKKTDTIIFKDTIFVENIKLDTIIKDTWYQLQLGLEYPNIIQTTPQFKSEKYIVTSYKKETINPPKKCKFLRMFQKKHKIVEVEVIENNPYINNNKQRFIEIINNGN